MIFNYVVIVFPTEKPELSQSTALSPNKPPSSFSQQPGEKLLCCSSHSMALPMSTAGIGGHLSGFHGSWSEDRATLSKALSLPVHGTRPLRPHPMMKNVNEGKGVFAPVVVLARNIIGRKRFNQLRGKAIALHSQVITEFCKTIGADGKQRQGLIRLAKKNGEKLGFLA